MPLAPAAAQRSSSATAASPASGLNGTEADQPGGMSRSGLHDVIVCLHAHFVAYPSYVEHDRHLDASLIHAGQQLLRGCHLGLRTRIKQGEAWVILDVLVAPLPQPGGKHMRVKIHQHGTYYIRGNGSGQLHSCRGDDSRGVCMVDSLRIARDPLPPCLMPGSS
jgi:hypothetical protein